MSPNDIVIIQQLVQQEREGRDRAFWNNMYQAYWPDGTVKLSWYQGDAKGFVDKSKIMSRSGALNAIHRLHPVSVRMNEDGDRAIATFSAVVEVRTELDGVEADLDTFLRFVYRAEKRQGTWKLLSLECAYQRDTLSPAVPGQSLKIDMDLFSKYRSSYRCMSYLFGKKGYPVNQELAGDDRPETVEKLYKSVFSWAGIEWSSLVGTD